MKIEKPRMNVWMKEKRSIPGIFVIIVVEGLTGKCHREFAFLKWIFPLLRIEDMFDNALGVKSLTRVVFIRSMSGNS